MTPVISFPLALASCRTLTRTHTRIPSPHLHIRSLLPLSMRVSLLLPFPLPSLLSYDYLLSVLIYSSSAPGLCVDVLNVY